MKDKPVIARLAANIGLLMRASGTSARSISKNVKVATATTAKLLSARNIGLSPFLLIMLSMADGQHDQDLTIAFKKSLTFYGTFDPEGYYQLSENLKRRR